MNKSIMDQIRQHVQAVDDILLVSHVRPDGDAIASILAFGLALQDAGKTPHLALMDGVPAALRYLPGWEKISKKADSPTGLVISLDCADRQRMGAVIGADTSVDINIDHHATSTLFGRINLVESDSVATCAILARLLPQIGLAITTQIAELLLAGILTDSQGFRTLNTNSQALRIAADLVDHGADLPHMYDQALSRRSFEAARYWGAGLSGLQRENGLVWASLSLDDRKLAGYRGRDDAEMVNVLSTIEGARMAIILIEQDPENVKVSWRGQAGVDVAQIAAQFGGGGHVAAAGAMLAGSLQEVEQKVIKASLHVFKEVVAG